MDPTAIILENCHLRCCQDESPRFVSLCCIHLQVLTVQVSQTQYFKQDVSDTQIFPSITFKITTVFCLVHRIKFWSHFFSNIMQLMICFYQFSEILILLIATVH